MAIKHKILFWLSAGIFSVTCCLGLLSFSAFAANDYESNNDACSVAGFDDPLICGASNSNEERELQIRTQNILNTIYTWIGIIAVIVIVIGGVRYMTSSGEPDRIKGAKNTIMYAIIGLVVTLAAFAITNLVIGALEGKTESGSGDDSIPVDAGADVPVKSLSVTSKITLVEGDGVQLRVKVLPDYATDHSLSFVSKDENVATVSSGGKVVAKKAGETEIIVTANNGVSAKVAITVIKPVQVESITLNPASLILQKGASKKITAVIKPSNAADKTIKWSSGDPSIVTVSDNGTVKAVKGGVVDIIATASNGVTAKCRVTVNASYWEIKNGKYIYHYNSGKTKEWTVSEYDGWRKLKEQNVKALNPNIPNESSMKKWKSRFTYAGVNIKYYVEDQRANNIAKKNGVSPYAITVDTDRYHESVFKKSRGTWEPYKFSKVNIGKTWKNSSWKNPDKSIYKKDTDTPIGLFYITGNRSLYGANSFKTWWVGFAVQYTTKNLGQYGQNGHGWNKEDYLHKTAASSLKHKCTNGCVTSFGEYAEWVYYNIGRGTPVLIW